MSGGDQRELAGGLFYSTGSAILDSRNLSFDTNIKWNAGWQGFLVMDLDLLVSALKVGMSGVTSYCSNWKPSLTGTWKMTGKCGGAVQQDFLDLLKAEGPSSCRCKKLRCCSSASTSRACLWRCTREIQS